MMCKATRVPGDACSGPLRTLEAHISHHTTATTLPQPIHTSLLNTFTMGAKDTAEKFIADNKVAVFSKSYCPCEWQLATCAATL